MHIIRTVKGDIKKKALGWCQCHEHILLRKGPSADVNPMLCLDDYGKSRAECILLKQAGGDSLVDCQPGRFGRMASGLIRLSEESGLNIVAVTGFHKLIFCEDIDFFAKTSAEKLIEHFIDEIEIGMMDEERRTDARAGVIKCALDENREADEYVKTYDKLFDSVCAAAFTTHAPILVHLDSKTDAIGLIDFFVNKGIKPERLIVCHLDRARYDFGYHEAVAQTGVYLEYDTINRLKYHSDQDEILLINHMISRGYAKQILMSMDTTRGRLKSYGAGFGLDYILTEFAGKMAAYGIEKKTIHRIMATNAANALAF